MIRPLLSSAMLLLAAGPALAETRFAQIDGVAACATIDDDSARLACYDAQMRALSPASGAAAPAPAQTPVPAPAPLPAPAPADPQETFGLSEAAIEEAQPERQAERVDSVSATIESAREFEPGKHRFTLSNGQVWEQTTSGGLYLPADMEGMDVEIRRGVFGYMMQVGDTEGLRVRRRE